MKSQSWAELHEFCYPSDAENAQYLPEKEIRNTPTVIYASEP